MIRAGFVRGFHRILCGVGIHERRRDGCLWHCIWCRPLAVLLLALSLAGCGGAQLAPPGMPSVADVRALQAETTMPPEVVREFWVSGLTAVQMRCGGFFDAAVMASLQAAQTQGQVALLSGLASALMGLGNVPTPYTAGAGLGGGFLSAMLSNQQQNSLAGPRPAGLATLTAAAQAALINATPDPRTGADAWASLYAVYRACSPAGIEALKEQAVHAAADRLSVTGGTVASRELAAGRSDAVSQRGRALPMVRVR